MRCSDKESRRSQPVNAVFAPQAHDYFFRLCVGTSTTVRQDKTIVDMAGSAAEEAAAIAEAVTAAIHRPSPAECGIPMIDGHPQPVNVEIYACLTVDGSGNFAGDAKSLIGVSQQQQKSEGQDEQ
jgi:hypothetical protein